MVFFFFWFFGFSSLSNRFNLSFSGCGLCVVADFEVASYRAVGEYYEAGEFGGTDTGGVEGGEEV